MAAGFIEAHIARGNRNVLVIGLVLTAIGGGLAALLNISCAPAAIQLCRALAQD